MKEYLILISIGPVQDFIASARKLRDLWFGSEMLSELSKVIAKSLNKQGCELIFPIVLSPDELEPNSELKVANKIFVKFAGERSPKEIIKTAKLAWKQAQTDYALRTLKKLNSIKQIELNEDLYKKQVGDSGEFFAAWVELSENYQASKDKLEQTLAGRKNLRDFFKANWDGYGLRKSSLDGARETVFTEKPKEIIGLLKSNEYLDTLGCIKRFFPISDGMPKYFDDLSDIALIPYLHKIYTDKNLEGLLSEYESYFNYATGLRSSHSRKHTNTELDIISDLLYADEKELKNIPGAWNALQKLTKAVGQPPKYACILLGDGDQMGVALDKINSYEGHQLFSKGLAVFANEVEGIIEGFHGNLIYAGGDDVMAYLPLHTAVEAANEVRLLFQKCMNGIFEELKFDKSKLPTFSIGLAIVHHSTPLDQALNLARKAETTAKNEGQRNALAIIQSKRNGSDITIYGKWER
jgi:CRISPR-associated protein Cmr2